MTEIGPTKNPHYCARCHWHQGVGSNLWCCKHKTKINPFDSCPDFCYFPPIKIENGKKPTIEERRKLLEKTPKLEDSPSSPFSKMEEALRRLKNAQPMEVFI